MQVSKDDSEKINEGPDDDFKTFEQEQQRKEKELFFEKCLGVVMTIYGIIIFIISIHNPFK